MSLRTIRLSLSMMLVLLLVLLGAGCGGEPPRTDGPTTAKEKQRLEATSTDDPKTKGGRSAWRYSGDREDCFFVVGKRCFKTEAAACAAARCGQSRCEIVGGGPASVVCAK
jgi:hypothetical protein